MIRNCSICESLTFEGISSFFCDFCQNWYHHECNLPMTTHEYNVSSCLNCNCELFPFSLCYDLSSNSKSNYLHPNFRTISAIERFAKDEQSSEDNVKCNYYTNEDFNSSFSGLSSYLSFLHLNISSLPKHLDELDTLLNSLDHNFKVLGISETRLTETSIPHNIEINGFKTPYLTSTKASAGGTALYVSKDVESKPRKDLSSIAYSDKELESTFCELVFETQENIIVGCIYKHPTLRTDTFTQNFFLPLLQKVCKENKRLVLLGDFNINLLEYGTSNLVNEFADSLHSYFLLPSISLPTRITETSGTLIDNIFFTPSQYNTTSGNLLVGLSDHLPQFLIFQQKFQRQTRNKWYRCWKNFDETKFSEDFSKIDWNQKLELDKNDPNLAFDNFFKITDSMVNEHAPMKKLSIRQSKKMNKPWVTKGIRISIDKREKLLNLSTKEKDQNAKNVLRNQYKVYRNQIVKLTRLSKINYYKSYFNSNIKNSKNIWKGVNELIDKNKSRNQDKISLNINGVIYTDPLKVADELNKHFTTIADKIRENINNDEKNNFARSLGNSPLNSLFFERIKTDEIAKIVNSLKPKANGPYSVPPKILKTVLAKISEILANIFNLSIQTGKFISSLKTTKVVPVYKNKGSPNDVNNYRPISLLSNIDKIFEKLIHARVVKFLDQNSIIYQNQFGFREKHSTKHALINLTENIRQSIDKGKYTCGVFIDLQKAFDTVDHEILLYKLNHYGIRGIANSWFRSYLKNREQFVSVDGCDSSKRFIKHGVPQGSVLGPLLFLIYINDLPNILRNCKTNLFADDTCLLFDDIKLQLLETKVNFDLSNLSTWLKANKISLNEDKTEVLLFRSKNKSVPYKMKLLLNGFNLNFSTQVRYLGLQLDEHLSWNYHFDLLAKKLCRANGILAKLRHFVPMSILRSIYFALFHSHVAYAAIIWGQAINYNSRVCRLQRRCIRIMTFSHFNADVKLLFINNCIPYLPEFIFACNIKLVYQTLKRLTPTSLQNCLNYREITHYYSTRNRELKILERPKANTLNYGLKSIKYQSLLNWNQLLLHTKLELTTLSPFILRRKTKEYLQAR